MTIPQSIINTAIEAVDEIDATNQVRTAHVKAALEAAEPELRAQIAADIRAQRVTCPTHNRTDCSPLLNGCSIPNLIHEALESAAQTAEGKQDD